MLGVTGEMIVHKILSQVTRAEHLAASIPMQVPKWVGQMYKNVYMYQINYFIMC